MHTREAREARDAFLDQLRTVVSCVTDRPLLSGSRVVDDPLSFRVSCAPPLEPAPMRQSRGSRLLFDMRGSYVIADAESPRDHIVTVGYSYRVLDHQEHELLAYHLHPDGPSDVIQPHLHVSGTWHSKQSSEVEPQLDRIHLLTGAITLRDVIGLLIVEFDVEPRRSDWRAILHRALSSH